MKQLGGCSCGALRYHLTSAPMFVHCCHCTICQKQTGSAFVINGLIETDRIVIEKGVPRVIAMPTESGRPHDVYRCPECLVAVWSDYGKRAGLRFVRLSTLDEPHAFVPDAHIFVRSKVPWVVLPAGQPAFDVFYELEKLWPADALSRRRALGL